MTIGLRVGRARARGGTREHTATPGCGKLTASTALLALCMAAPMAAGAEDSSWPRSRSDREATGAADAEQAHLEFGGYGLGSQDYWIAAPQFTALTDDRQWAHSSLLYFTNPQAVSAWFAAQIELPAGAVMQFLECLYYDASPLDSTATLIKHRYAYDTDTPSDLVIASVPSSGAGGYQKPFTALDETVRYREGAYRYIYTLRVVMPADTSVRFRGCRIFWHRSLSPAPATATFADVATSHGQFQFVEALAAAGITGGCGNGNFCPNAPLTRGQMAVFLSVALGLHFPY